MDQVVKQNKVLFFLEKTLSCETLEFFKKLCNKSNSQAIFYLSKKGNNNLYVTPKNGINYIFTKKKFALVFFAANLKVEAALLNFRLRMIFKKTLFSIFNFGAVSSNINSNFFGSTFKGIQKFLEGKIFFLSKLFLNIIFIQGASFNKAVDLNLYYTFLQEKLKSLKIITLKLFCNEEGSQLLNFKTCSFKNKSLIFAFQNKETQTLKKFATLMDSKVF